MLYYLFEFLEKEYQLPGAGLFQFMTFRAAMAILCSLLIATAYGKRIILFLQKQQIGESIRDLGLEGQKQKAGTPTMGGPDHYHVYLDSRVIVRKAREHLYFIIDRDHRMDGFYRLRR